MGEVINLGRVRKRKQREAQRRQAEANALAYGRDKSDKFRDRLEQAHQQAVLDGARLEPANDDADTPSDL